MFRPHERYQLVLTDPVDLLTIANSVFNIPEGKKFAPDEVGLILSSLTGGVVTQPTVSFGYGSGHFADIKAAAITTRMSALLNRELFTSLLTNDVLSALSFSVTSAGVGPSVYKARIYFRGILY